VARFYPPFEIAERLGRRMVEIDAPDVAALLRNGSAIAGCDLEAEATRWTLLVNGRNIRYLDGFRTPLRPDDEVFFVKGSGGG
jgi:molybdopterin converting factor small subunit